MEFSITFVEVFFIGIYFAMPLLVLFLVIISLLGLWGGGREGWSRSDGLYYAFITATTVGYGDRVPVSRFSKLLAVKIAFMGLMFTGIFVSIAVNAAGVAFKETNNIDSMKAEFRQMLE
jgi:voltage-gated potassium channel